MVKPLIVYLPPEHTVQTHTFDPSSIATSCCKRKENGSRKSKVGPPPIQECRQIFSERLALCCKHLQPCSPKNGLDGFLDLRGVLAASNGLVGYCVLYPMLCNVVLPVAPLFHLFPAIPLIREQGAPGGNERRLSLAFSQGANAVMVESHRQRKRWQLSSRSDQRHLRQRRFTSKLTSIMIISIRWMSAIVYTYCTHTERDPV